MKKLKALERRLAQTPALAFGQVPPGAVHVGGQFPNSGLLIEAGVLVLAELAIPKIHEDALRLANLPVAAPVHGFMLVDTGATVSCISIEVATKLGLKQTGYRTTFGAHGPNQMPEYLVRVMVPMDDGAGNQVARFIERPIGAVPQLNQAIAHLGIAKNGTNYDLVGLLGRDFLASTTLIYRGAKGSFDIVLEP